MLALNKSLAELVAADLMSPQVIYLTEDMPVREAAQLLLQHQVSGAPVVDSAGRCVGMLSTTDFVRLLLKRSDAAEVLSPPLPITCPFLEKRHTPEGEVVILCTLPLGVCPIQSKQLGPDGELRLVCSQPHCVLADWQVVDVDKLPDSGVRNFMTADPVTVGPDTPIRVVARKMIDAHIHRVVVVDEQERPIGIVSGTDVLAAVAYSGNDP